MKNGRAIKAILYCVTLIFCLGTCFIIGYLMTIPNYIPVSILNKYIGSDGEVRYKISLTEQTNDVYNESSLYNTVNGSNSSSNSSSSSSSGSTSNSGNSNVGISSTNLIELSKAVAENFHVPAYETGSTSYDGEYSYSGNSGNIKGWVADPLVINEKSAASGGATYRDCSTYVSLMLYFSGATSTYTHLNSSAIATTYQDKEKSASTFADVSVGDIMWTSGHVGMVVKIEGDTVYIGECGSSSAIKQTAELGYRDSFNKSEDVKSWRSGVRVFSPV
jgi:hypothetical protein